MSEKVFVITETMMDMLNALEEGQRLMHMMALTEYFYHGTIPAFSGSDKAIWIALKSVVDGFNDRYEVIDKHVDGRRNTSAANGRKGGRPRKSEGLIDESEEPSENLNKPTENLNENLKKPNRNLTKPNSDEEKEEKGPLSPDGSSLLLPPTPPIIITSPLPTISTQKEKEKEGNGYNASHYTCPELKNSSRQVETAEPSEPPFISLPLNTGDMWPVTEKMVTDWQALYPAVDVRQQLRSMLGWTQSNPRNRKTARGISRFITSWLSRAQDKAPRVVQQPQQPERKRLHTEEDYYEGYGSYEAWLAHVFEEADKYTEEQKAKAGG